MRGMLTKIATSVAVCAALVTASSAEDVVKIGVQAPITGKYANEGQSIENGVRLVVDQINADGGVLGKKLEVVTCDDEGQAQKAAICARKLVNEDVLAVIGSYTSGATEAAQTTYYRNETLQTSDGTSDSLTKNGYWTFFRNSFQNSAQAEFTAEYLVNERGFDRIAVLSDYSSYAVGLADSAVEAINDVGGNIVYQGKIKSGTQNFTAVLTKIKSMNPDVIYFSGYFSDGGLLRAQQKQLGIDATFVGGDSNDNPDFMKLAGDSAEGTLLVNFPTPEFLPYDAAKKFLSDYRAKYDEDPASVWALMNIDGLKAIVHGIEETESFDPKTISNFLHTLEDFPGITGPVTFREDGERINTKFNVYEVQADNSYKIINQ